jgi:MoxR-like ATPase
MSASVLDETTVNNLVQDSFRLFRSEANQCMVERDDEIKLVLCALLVNEHCCLQGPPGTAKSMTIDLLMSWLCSRAFKAQLNRYMPPEEILGQLSIVGLKKDEYRRILAGKAADCEILFLDEIFNASPALLNSLLLLLNERVIYNGSSIVQTPLKICVAASNQWPGEGAAAQELNALFDRFLFRKSVRPIASDRGMDTLLWGNLPAPVVSTTLSEAELKCAQADVANLPFGQAAKDAFTQIRRQCRQEGIVVGDRRLRKSVNACRAAAWLAGHVEVEPEDLEILQHVLWVDPSEQPEHVAKIVGTIAAPQSLEINGYLAEAEEVASAMKAGDLAAMSVTVKKLDEIVRKLGKLKGERAEQSKAHVETIAREIKRRALESVGV